MLFDEGVDAELDEELRPELNRLLEMKKTLPEMGMAPKVQIFNDYNQEAKNYLATDYMAFSPNVEIFRGSHGALSEETYIVDVLTAAAPIGVTSGKLRGIMRPLESYIWKVYTNWCEM